MNSNLPIALIAIIITNVAFSILGFQRRDIMARYAFHVGSIQSRNQLDRLVSSMFLHAGVGHLLFNMFALYSFGDKLELVAPGSLLFVLIYMVSGIGGNLFALFVNRNHPDYLAVGASGAVSGILFASILIFPGGSVYIIPIPIPIPDWVFAFGFILVSIFGIGANYGNIGHEAHLGGAVLGILLSVILYPGIVVQSPYLLSGLIVPVVAFIALMLARPDLIEKYRKR